MFSKQICEACYEYPINHKQRFLLYPTLAIYSSIENSIKTTVGVIFTALSLITFGLYQPINIMANWTRYSRGILTIPAQIFGNIFHLQSQTLMEYNISRPLSCAGKNIKKDLEEANLVDADEILEKFIKDPCGSTCDIKLKKAQNICSHLFLDSTKSSIQLLKQHIVFRISLVINTIVRIVFLTITIPLIAAVATPIAFFKGLKNQKANEFALTILKLPEMMHCVSLSLRMIVNPLQFVISSADEDLESDSSHFMQALHHPSIFWLNSLEMQNQ